MRVQNVIRNKPATKYAQYLEIYARRALDGKTLPQVARELKISPSGLNTWVKTNALDLHIKFAINGAKRRGRGVNTVVVET